MTKRTAKRLGVVKRLLGGGVVLAGFLSMLFWFHARG